MLYWKRRYARIPRSSISQARGNAARRFYRHQHDDDGYAYQKGLLPLTAAAIEQAIEINGVGIKMNTRRFSWGVWPPPIRRGSPR